MELDPLVGLDDVRKPLRSKLLAVPSLKARYLEHVRQIAEEDLDWKNLEPKVSAYRALIEDEVQADTRKLTSLEAFQAGLGAGGEAAPEGRRPRLTLREFAEQRRRYLLNHPEVSKKVTSQR